MKDELPWLFRGEMVRALLAGTKSQSRRLIDFNGVAKQSGCTNGTLAWSPTFNSWAVFNGNGEADLCLVKCPYVVGQRRWVRETWAKLPCAKEEPCFDCQNCRDGRVFRADNDIAIKWKPSIFMPRWASRITLVITQVRVQRLQDISEEDAYAEGVEEDRVIETQGRKAMQFKQYQAGVNCIRALAAYSSLWDSINAKKHPWSENCWVWAISFRKL